MRLAGKVALITGAGSGQGREAAVLFATEGAKVVVTDINEEGIEQTLDQVEDAGGEAVGQSMDVSEESQVEAAVALAVESFGQLNVLYNNAGVYLWDRDGPVTEMEDGIWDTILSVNLKGMYLCCRHAIPEMIKAGGGAIASTASSAALIGSRSHAYSASKGGIIALSRSIATTYAAENVRSNVICPGIIDTPMVAGHRSIVNAYAQETPLHRVGTPVDVAYMALYLVSDEAAFVTGGIFTVDGGVTAK